MDIFEAIQKRHSYRGPFRGEPIPPDHLRRIVQAGIQAPSGKNLQTTTFVIVNEPGLVAHIRAMHETNTAMQQAQAYIACIVDKHPESVHEGPSFEVEDCAAAVENMLLAVTGLGYATVWVDNWLRAAHRAEIIGRHLGVPEEKIIRIILPIGVPAETHRQKEKQPFEARAWFNRYGG